jgi:acetylornithine deacetylase/succinyl-diaminopimelate desuccinylase-like protein
MAHIAALRAFGDDLPVGVVVFVEGEEEFGSESLAELLRQHRDKVTADVIVIADSGNWDVGHPALTTSLRGIVNTFIEVRTLDHAHPQWRIWWRGARRTHHVVPAARHASRRRR